MTGRAGRVGAVLGVAAVALAVVFGIRADTGADPTPSPAAGQAPAPRSLRIMPLGSSSTVGAGSPATAGFRGPLESMLRRDGLAYDMVGSQHSGPPWMADRDHEGHGGWTMARMQPLVAGWVARQHPDVVLLQVGTNDLNTGTSAADTAQRLNLMLDTIHAASPAFVVVAGVWAPLRSRPAARAEYARLAAATVARHRAMGQATTFVDTSTMLGPGDVFDGLHPDAAGYVKIATMWDREIRSYLTARH